MGKIIRNGYDLSRVDNVVMGRNITAYVYNSGKFPVIEADIDKFIRPGEDSTSFDAVSVDVYRKKKNEYIRAHGRLYRKPTGHGYQYSVLSGGACISASFTFGDVIEMMENAKAPVIKEGDVVVIPLVSKKDGFIVSQMMKVGRCETGYITITDFTPLSEEEMESLTEDAIRWLSR